MASLCHSHRIPGTYGFFLHKSLEVSCRKEQVKLSHLSSGQEITVVECAQNKSLILSTTHCHQLDTMPNFCFEPNVIIVIYIAHCVALWANPTRGKVPIKEKLQTHFPKLKAMCRRGERTDSVFLFMLPPDGCLVVGTFFLAVFLSLWCIYTELKHFAEASTALWYLGKTYFLTSTSSLFLEWGFIKFRCISQSSKRHTESDNYVFLVGWFEYRAILLKCCP